MNATAKDVRFVALALWTSLGVFLGGGCLDTGGKAMNQGDRPLAAAAGCVESFSVADDVFAGWGEPGRFVRTYEPSLAAIDGPLGRGWAHSFNMAVGPKIDGGMTLREADGRRTEFQLRGGHYESSGDPRVLTKREDGTLLLADPLGHSWSFDDHGRLAAVSGSGNVLTLMRNADGLLTCVAGATNQVMRMEYDGSGRLTRIIGADGGTCLYSYDSHGNLTACTSEGRTSRYTYDAEHRMMQRSSDETHADTR